MKNNSNNNNNVSFKLINFLENRFSSRKNSSRSNKKLFKARFHVTSDFL